MSDKSIRYCIWNNKGGVGKTFLTYCLSIEYALRHPQKRVVVIDMCPQANVSEMLLGGNGIGEDNLAECFNNERTIVHYIKKRYHTSPFSRIGNEIHYFVKVCDYNLQMPDNLWLLPGNNDLDICAEIIEYIARAPSPGVWIKSRSFVRNLIDIFDDWGKNKSVVFIDTNPSFSNYTQMGLLAADQLIVPCTADSASIRGIGNVLRLIHGIKTGKNQFSDDDIFNTFNTKISEAGIDPPKIHLFVLNKARTIDKTASVAYKSHVHEIEIVTKNFLQNYSDSFTNVENRQRVFEIKYCNTLSPVLSFTGLPPSALQHGRYSVYDQKTQVNQNQITPFLSNIKAIVEQL
jgi:cellulose biosynthesis protein BcsQ